VTIRYLYEVAPLSYIIEQAGGIASDGRHRSLELTPASVHQRVPCYMGSKLDVQDVERCFREYDDAASTSTSAASEWSSRPTRDHERAHAGHTSRTSSSIEWLWALAVPYAVRASSSIQSNPIHSIHLSRFLSLSITSTPTRTPTYDTV